jgi:hypothetical protein
LVRSLSFFFFSSVSGFFTRFCRFLIAPRFRFVSPCSTGSVPPLVSLFCAAVTEVLPEISKWKLAVKTYVPFCFRFCFCFVSVVLILAGLLTCFPLCFCSSPLFSLNQDCVTEMARRVAIERKFPSTCSQCGRSQFLHRCCNCAFVSCGAPVCQNAPFIGQQCPVCEEVGSSVAEIPAEWVNNLKTKLKL